MALSSFVLTDVAKPVATEYSDVPMVLTSFGEPQQPNLSLATASYLEICYATCCLLAKLADDGRLMTRSAGRRAQPPVQAAR